MNGKEAFQLVRRVEGRYGIKYQPKDLGRVWPDLIKVPLEIASQAVGACFMIWQRAPRIEDVVEAITKRQAREMVRQVELARPEGEAMFAIMDGFMSGRISEAEYIMALYAASETFGNPEYASQAAEREELRRQA